MPVKTRELANKTCKTCGSEFGRRRFNGRLEDASRFEGRLFCSQSCANTKSNPSDRTTFHLRARRHIKSACQECGTASGLEVHHIDRNIKNNDPENLQTLCRSCHMKLHWKEDEKFNRRGG
ncbi:HNH endonuclease signature motif containing protein [Spirosoma lacussanchae]|uniref:HNH endonuclease signature motif containing protein n=1 Tax=Spirosoma lacussanchae TaxID=1884249 RepID=UPI001109C98F